MHGELDIVWVWETNELKWLKILNWSVMSEDIFKPISFLIEILVWPWMCACMCVWASMSARVCMYVCVYTRQTVVVVSNSMSGCKVGHPRACAGLSSAAVCPCADWETRLPSFPHSVRPREKPCHPSLQTPLIYIYCKHCRWRSNGKREWDKKNNSKNVNRWESFKLCTVHCIFER